MSLSKQDLIDVDALIDGAVLQVLMVMCVIGISLAGMVVVVSFEPLDPTNPVVPFTLISCFALMLVIIVVAIDVWRGGLKSQKRIKKVTKKVEDAQEIIG